MGLLFGDKMFVNYRSNLEGTLNPTMFWKKEKLIEAKLPRGNLVGWFFLFLGREKKAMKRILTLFVVLTVLLGFWQSSLGAGKKAKNVEGGQTEKELLAYPEGTVLDVYISSDNPKIIIGKLTDGTTIQILTIHQLPQKSMKTPVGYGLSRDYFKYVTFSPDKKKIAFSSFGKTWNWVGLFDLNTSSITQVEIIDGEKIIWSSNSRYLAIEGKSAAGFYTINVYETETEKRVLEIWDRLFKQKGMALQQTRYTGDIKDGWELGDEGIDMRFIKWSEDSEEIYFETVNVAHFFTDTEVKRKEYGPKKIWAINLYTTVLREIPSGAK